MPDTEDLKSKFNEKLEKFSNAKKEIEKDIERLKAEVKSKKDHRRNILQDVTTKEVNPKHVCICLAYVCILIIRIHEKSMQKNYYACA